MCRDLRPTNFTVKKSLFSKTSNSGWQREHGEIIHQTCLRVKKLVAAGHPIQKTIRRVARGLNGKPFKCDPSRRLKLSPQSLRRWWDIWRRGGEVAAAVRLKFAAFIKPVPVQVLRRFVEYCGQRCHRSLSDAWRSFLARGTRVGRGRGVRMPVEVSDYQLRKYIPTPVFKTLQSALKDVEAAEARLQEVKFAAIQGVLNQVPTRPTRQRAEMNFSI